MAIEREHRIAREQPLEALQVRRFGDVLVETGVDRGLDVRVLAVAAQGDEPCRQVVAVLPNPAGEIEPAHDRQTEIDEREIDEINAKLAPSAGTCMVMGTASTMALCTEALGMMLPGGACPPAVMDQERRFLEALQAASYWERGGDILIIFDGERRQRLRFSAVLPGVRR